MSDVSSEQLQYVLIRMGYEPVSDDGVVAVYRDAKYPGYPERRLRFDFSRGAVTRIDLQRQLVWEGVNPDVFFTELDSIFG